MAGCDSTEDTNSNNSSGNSGAGSSDDATDGSDAADVPALGNRTFGIFALEPENRDFGQNVIQPIVSSGASSTTLSVYWDDIEGTASTYEPAINYLEIGEIFYPPYGLAINLSFSVIDTNNKRLAPHLSGRAFDDPDVICSFIAMLDWAKTQIPTLNVKTLHIGNEVDVYLDQNSIEWPAWITFFTATSAHARTLWPDAVVGCKTTYGGITLTNRAATIDLHTQADATFLTYYHMDGNFMVLAPAAISNTFSDIASYPVEKPIHLLEIGVPSDTRNGGSEQHQADTVTEMFRA
ncbi:MAG: hypothetical protein AB8B87_27425 [Granulosicoccus sp.]